MRIDGVGHTRIAASRHKPRETPTKSRALTTVTPPPARDGAAFRSMLRSDAALVVQLFAARDGVPQARERRRAEPAVASAAYLANLNARRPALVRAVDLVA